MSNLGDRQCFYSANSAWSQEGLLLFINNSVHAWKELRELFCVWYSGKYDFQKLMDDDASDAELYNYAYRNTFCDSGNCWYAQGC